MNACLAHFFLVHFFVHSDYTLRTWQFACPERSLETYKCSTLVLFDQYHSIRLVPRPSADRPYPVSIHYQ